MDIRQGKPRAHRHLELRGGRGPILPALPYILAAAGTVASVSAASSAAKERKESLNRMLGIQAEEQAGMTKLGKKAAEQYEPTTRENAAAAVTSEQKAGIDKAIEQAQTAAPVEAATGRVSDAYGRAVQSGAATTSARNAQLADLLSKVMTPGQLQLQEGINASRIGTEGKILGTDTGAAIGSERATYGGIEPNPYLTFGGQALTAAGGALASQQSADKIKNIYGNVFAQPKPVASPVAGRM